MQLRGSLQGNHPEASRTPADKALGHLHSQAQAYHSPAPPRAAAAQAGWGQSPQVLYSPQPPHGGRAGPGTTTTSQTHTPEQPPMRRASSAEDLPRPHTMASPHPAARAHSTSSPMPAPVLINGVPNKPLLLTPQHDTKRGQTSSPGVALAPTDAATTTTATTAGVPYGPLFASPDKVDPHGAPASPLFTSLADPYHQHYQQQQQQQQQQHAYQQPPHEPLPGALFHQPSASTLSSPLSAHPHHLHHHGGVGGYDPHGAYIDPRAEPDYGAHLRSGSFDHHHHRPLSHGYGEQQHHNPHEHLAAAAGHGDDEFYSPYVTPAKDHGNRPRPDLSVQVRLSTRNQALSVVPI